MNKRRLGKFRFYRSELIREWEDLLPVMGNFVVMQADYRYDLDAIEYLAYSPLFEEIEDSIAAPEYEIEIQVMDGRPAQIVAHKKGGPDA